MSLRDWPILRQLSPNFFSTVRMAFVFGSTGGNALLIGNDDKIYGVGANFLGCLGLGDSTARLLPTEVPSLSNKNIEGLACGGEHGSTLFLVAHFHSGEICQWGYVPHINRPSNQYSNNRPITKPQPVGSSLKIKVKTVTCGLVHTMMLSCDGRVFTWGRNESGQLGYEGNQTYDHHYGYYGVAEPHQVKGIIEGKTVVEISSGACFSVALLNTGKVVTWGDNKSGQLGINNQSTHSFTPVKVTGLDKIVIKKIACGSSHVLALSKVNILYLWGDNSHSQLGFRQSSNAAIKHYLQPREIDEFRFIDIGATYACNLSVAQLETQEIYVWGKLSTGQIISHPTDSQCESMDQVFAHYASPNMMRRPMRHVLEAKRQTTVSQTLANEFGNQDSSDLTIVVDKNEIHVHQSILKMRSEYFRTMLARWVKKDEKVITIKKKSFNVIYTYLKFLYTDKLDVSLNDAVELLQLADEYGDDSFKSICEKSIKRDMKPDKVAEIFALTRKIKSCQDLNRFCLDYAMNHAKEMISSAGFKKWDVDTMRAAFVAYVGKKENC